VKGWLLDTNVIAEVSGAKPDQKVREWVDGQPEHTLYLSILTLGEYHKGIHNLPQSDPRRRRIEQGIRAVEARFAGRLLPVSNAIVFRWGAISGRVKRLTGHSPAVVDTLLAATAIEHNLYLATRNVAHVAHSGAAAFNPWTDNPAHFPL
jgi:hypothetical protein